MRYLLDLKGETPFVSGGGLDHTIIVEVSCYDEDTDLKEIAEAVESVLTKYLPQGNTAEVINVLPGYTGEEGFLRRG